MSHLVTMYSLLSCVAHRLEIIRRQLRMFASDEFVPNTLAKPVPKLGYMLQSF